VSLEVNIRAPDVLSRLQTEMRKGDISADMWNLYLSRVLLPNDERLLEAPFSTERVQYIVHRHRLRIRQSYRNAVEECKLTGKRLYVIKAADEVKEIDRPRFTAAVRRELTDLANPRHTKFIPSILPLYIGMRLLLYSKDCVRFGLMNGCECILEQIVFADEENLPAAVLAGEAIELEFMPATLILRAVDVPWTLLQQDLPQLAPSTNRRGLFQLRPKQEHLRRKVGEDAHIQVRRTGFAVAPADTRIVYQAQGETYKAIIADMQRPPRMDKSTHWLACYVMMSRATSLEGFLVLRPALKEELNTRPPQYLIDEIDRLLALERKSTTALLKYLQLLQDKVPEEHFGIVHPASFKQRVLTCTSCSSC
jgi:hypothetical protein